MYLAIGIALVLLFVAYSSFAGKKEEDVEQLTFESEIKSGGLKADIMDEVNSRADFFKKLDQQVKIEFDSTGYIQLPSMCRLRYETALQAMVAFKARKEILMEERIAAMKREDWDTYAAKINEAAKEYQQVVG